MEQTYIITIENDMRQQLVFHAANISDAIEKAQVAFTETMVTALDGNGEFRNKPLSYHPKIIRLSPEKPTAQDNKPPTKEERAILRERSVPK